jgi:hypothetical protein
MPSNELQFWMSFSALLIAGWSAYNSWRSRRIATRALAISESQEQRRHPQLGIYQANGCRRYLPERQLFSFLVSVTNPTDINNSIAQAELQVTYLLEGDITATCRIPHNLNLSEILKALSVGGVNVFSLPTCIDAHQTVAGWFLFSVDNALFAGKTIDSHKILLEDSHGICTETEPVVVRDWSNETAER